MKYSIPTSFLIALLLIGGAYTFRPVFTLAEGGGGETECNGPLTEEEKTGVPNKTKIDKANPAPAEPSVVINCVKRTYEWAKNSTGVCQKIYKDVAQVIDIRPRVPGTPIPIPPTGPVELAYSVYSTIDWYCPWELPLGTSHCENKKKDVDETGIDCGGRDCPACATTPPGSKGSLLGLLFRR